VFSPYARGGDEWLAALIVALPLPRSAVSRQKHQPPRLGARTKRRHNLARNRKVKAPCDVNYKSAILGDLMPDIVGDDPDGFFVHTPAQNEPDAAQRMVYQLGGTTGSGQGSLARAIGDSPPETPI
jgi:hypothetical protein